MRPRSILVVAAIALTTALSVRAQESFSTGQNIAPAYEGWEKNPDGSFNLVFGYFNRNWQEEIDVPVGPGNTIDPGGPDRGQPTHLQPRRNRFVFRVKVPADFGAKELVWTLTTNGKTEKAYASLKPDYYIDDDVIMANNGAAGMGGADPALKGNKALNPGIATRFTVDSATGLRLSWFVYRGAGNVVFDPVQAKVWEDTRDNANSPWSYGWRTPPVPPDGMWVVRATFREPGTFVLRCLAHDGGLSTTDDVTVVVK